MARLKFSDFSRLDSAVDDLLPYMFNNDSSFKEHLERILEYPDQISLFRQKLNNLLEVNSSIQDRELP